ncbi:MAG: hypothetical protein QF464_18365, partial [Myxococcota bacterium]|nr:hypothetical protein [Myxococcota bacterium]
DNPNVFQICTLHRTRSELRKRQEIGRGLRLPVMANGHRCHDPDLARLTVVANESYDSFARRLQAEIAEECEVDFGERVIDKRALRELALRDGWRDDPEFLALWARIGRPLRPTFQFPQETLTEACVAAVAAIPTGQPGAVVARRGRLELERDGVHATALEGPRRTDIAPVDGPSGASLPNPLASLQRETGLTRRTLAHVLVASNRLDDLCRDPVGFLDAASAAICGATRRIAARHATYDCQSENPVSSAGFEGRLGTRAGRHVVPMRHAIHLGVPARNEREARWLESLDRDDAVRHVLRWPTWHRVDSPMGALDLGWIVARTDGITCYPDAAVIEDAAHNACIRAACAALDVTLGDRLVSN